MHVHRFAARNHRSSPWNILYPVWELLVFRILYFVYTTKSSSPSFFSLPLFFDLSSQNGNFLCRVPIWSRLAPWTWRGWRRWRCAAICWWWWRSKIWSALMWAGKCTSNPSLAPLRHHHHLLLWLLPATFAFETEKSSLEEVWISFSTI